MPPETILQPGFTQEAFDAFLATREEPAWVTDLRRRAWNHFLELPLPDDEPGRVAADRSAAVPAG